MGVLSRLRIEEVKVDEEDTQQQLHLQQPWILEREMYLKKKKKAERERESKKVGICLLNFG